MKLIIYGTLIILFSCTSIQNSKNKRVEYQYLIDELATENAINAKKKLIALRYKALESLIYNYNNSHYAQTSSVDIPVGGHPLRSKITVGDECIKIIAYIVQEEKYIDEKKYVPHALFTQYAEKLFNLGYRKKIIEWWESLKSERDFSNIRASLLMFKLD